MPKRKTKRQTSAKKTKRARSLPPKILKPVPFAFGFQPPDLRHVIRATGIDSRYPDPEFVPTDAFRPVQEPLSDLDWLANYREGGQSYSRWLLTNRWLRSVSNAQGTRCQFNPTGSTIPERYPNGKIYLLPLGSFGDAQDTRDSFDVAALAEYTKLFYGLPVEVLPPVPVEFSNGNVIAKLSRRRTDGSQTVGNNVPSDGTPDCDEALAVDDIELTTRYDAGTDHYQVRVDSGMLGLRTLMPDDGLLMVVISLLDVYQSKTDLFVAGIGSASSKMGYFSFFRYDSALSFSEEDWFDYEIRANCKENRRKLQLQRCCKLLVHEIGHIFGIGHCIYFSCVMNGSGNLDEDYRQPHHLCPIDLRKIHELCGMDVITRYKGLAKFYESIDMLDEADWVRGRVCDIEKRRLEKT